MGVKQFNKTDIIENKKGPIILLTDFGVGDPFVGQIKGVISGISPGTHVIDLSHNVPPQRIDIGAFFLEGSREYFPKDSIFVAVVDPDVGTSRRAVILRAHSQYFIGPDNGILFPVTRGSQLNAYQIENPKYRLKEVSSTFHARDIFAPAAAYLAEGVPMESFGRRIHALTPLVLPRAHIDGAVIKGEVVHVDSFGNAWTNISRKQLQESGILSDPEAALVTIGSIKVAGLSVSYRGYPEKTVVALLNSFNLLEIACPNDSISRKFGITQGTHVQVQKV